MRKMIFVWVFLSELKPRYIRAGASQGFIFRIRALTKVKERERKKERRKKNDKERVKGDVKHYED